jgi:hypothetical protein
VRVEELSEHPFDLHARRITLELKPSRGAALQELDELSLELWVCGGGFEIREQLGHRRRRLG